MSSSSKSPSRQRSRQKLKTSKHKMFVTNLDGTAKEQELKSELDQLFSKYGTLKDLTVKKSKNSQYSFAFVEYQPGQDAQEAIRNLNNYVVKGKQMKVELQDDTKRRKDPDKGCYTCGRKGHFARQCRFKSNSNNFRGRSRSRSSSGDRNKKRRRRNESRSSQKKSKNKKDRKHSSKDKKKKKHKKTRQRSSSDSQS